LKPNTLFFFFSTNSWYIDTYPKNLILEAMQVLLGAATLFFYCYHVAAFGSQDLGFRTCWAKCRVQFNSDFIYKIEFVGGRFCHRTAYLHRICQSPILPRNVTSDRQTNATSDFIYKIDYW
jgi:hypothetical protein